MTTSATTLTLESDLRKLADLQCSVDALCRDAGCDDSGTFQLTLVVIEAVTNCIKHGYRGEPGHLITIDWNRTDDCIEIEIRDRGIPLPADVLSRTTMPPPEAEGGRGWPMILAWTDSARIARIGDENVLNLTRRCQ
ncbi:ATP-binding protein [uncultured Thiodictyon sp.]|uniref:ATP-binding protein n=1 Tax=uncultured Thiodictyon sp. TaxID=1846217 RepID=UPI0025DBFAC3|nr:ATP-binding protein [uncultured Thiodictyon sp.]